MALASFTDSHVHLDMLDDPEAALQQASAAGVGQMVAVGIDLQSSRRAIEYAGRFPYVSAAVGIHPHDAAAADDAAMAELEEIAARPGVVAIGETGLDYYRDRSPRDVQQHVFHRHIALARRLGLPLMVHSRDAAADTLRLLAADGEGLTVVLHCFSLAQEVKQCAEAGYYMSLAGNITFRNASSLRDAASRIPAELLLTETDAPFLAPDPYRGRENSPAHIPLIVRRLAEVRDEPLSLLADRIKENFRKVFSTP